MRYNNFTLAKTRNHRPLKPLTQEQTENLIAFAARFDSDHDFANALTELFNNYKLNFLWTLGFIRYSNGTYEHPYLGLGSGFLRRYCDVFSTCQKIKNEFDEKMENNLLDEGKKSDQFNPRQKAAIRQMQKSLTVCDQKGIDPTNISRTAAYRRHIEDIMSVIGANSEDEAIEFVKNFQT